MQKIFTNFIVVAALLGSGNTFPVFPRGFYGFHIRLWLQACESVLESSRLTAFMTSFGHSYDATSQLNLIKSVA